MGAFQTFFACPHLGKKFCAFCAFLRLNVGNPNFAISAPLLASAKLVERRRVAKIFGGLAAF